jgi:selenocysteine-specific elongation factor
MNHDAPSPSPRHVVIGMAGHIDHGKTALVKALTGTDTDRLKEEKERGMTTDLGFAFLGDTVTVIDVPGHERFVKTMVAGVNTVDLAVLVIAADDGIMPQTEEHLDILNLLQIPGGLVAVNKMDLVDADWLNLVMEDVKKRTLGTVLGNGPVIPVSAVTGQNLDILKNEIMRMAGAVQDRRDRGVFRMPVDRVFSIKGFGTVVAGTVLSGHIALEDEVELLPQKTPLRVRGLQVHDRIVNESRVGFRTAVNVMGVEKEKVERGNVLAESGFFKPTRMADVRFSSLASWNRPVRNRERVHVHIGTDEALARVILLDKESLPPGESGFAQLHFEKPVVMDADDRFVARSYSPVRTLGGGWVLDPHPVKHKRLQPELLAHLEGLIKGDSSRRVLDILDAARFQPVQEEALAKLSGISSEGLLELLSMLENEKKAVRTGKNRWISAVHRKLLDRNLTETVRRFHSEHPERTGIPRAELLSRIRPPSDKILFEEAVKGLVQDGVLAVESDRVRLLQFQVTLSPMLREIREEMVKALTGSSFSPPDEREIIARFGENGKTILQVLVDSSELVRLDEGVLFHRDLLEKAKQMIRSFIGSGHEATVSELRVHLGTSRKYAVPLVEYLDRIGFTEREGDVRRLKE